MIITGVSGNHLDNVLTTCYTAVQGWPTSTHRKDTQFLKDLPESHTCVYLYWKWEEDEFSTMPLFANSQLTLKVRLHHAIVGLTEAASVV